MAGQRIDGNPVSDAKKSGEMLNLRMAAGNPANHSVGSP
jgi:hypothetical protein